MRMTFVDIYNLITVQCDYFDNQFMDTEKPEQVKMIYSIPNILYQKKMMETQREFNDMGIMQALDIVSTTLCCVYEIIKKLYI